jgi:L-lactate dehydrogenase
MNIGIVGNGLVGSTAAYAIIMRGLGRKIVLVDKDKKRSIAETNDLLHAIPFANPLTIRDGNYEDLADCKLVVIAAGVSQKIGENRLDLLKRNADVFEKVIPAILSVAPESILVVATNPLDVMTYIATRFAAGFGVTTTRVLGTGTMLDTARFRSLLGAVLDIDPQHVHGYVVGEHGDSEVLTWSLATVGAMGLEDFCKRRSIPFSEDLKRRIDGGVRNAAYSIIEGKGATYYGIGSAIAKLVDVILHDQRSILTVSTMTSLTGDIADVSISMPNLVGGNGILETLPLPLDAEESAELKRSAEILKEEIQKIDLK